MSAQAHIPRKILLGVTGGIAAYKSPDLVRRLTARGCEVQVVLSEAGRHFVQAPVFQAVSGRRVREDLWDEEAEAAMGHIELARWADAVLVAPATAHFIGTLAAGLAGDLLNTLCLATAAPVLLAPAMNQQMWANAAVQSNCRLLESRGIRLLGPGYGSQACGDHGLGRMLEPAEIVDALLTPPSQAMSGPFARLKIVVTAGPTREPIDPVRYITNKSSGRMGFAIAEAAREAGAEVVLVCGPVTLPAPNGVRRVDVETAEQMYRAVHDEMTGTAVFIACAAVADYRPQQAAAEKIKRTEASMHLDLVRSPDTLASVAALEHPPFTVGFAAETHNVAEFARQKLARKGVDMIAANRVGRDCGFDREVNELTVYWPGGERRLGEASKAALARHLMDVIAERFVAAQVAPRANAKASGGLSDGPSVGDRSDKARDQNHDTSATSVASTPETPKSGASQSAEPH